MSWEESVIHLFNLENIPLDDLPELIFLSAVILFLLGCLIDLLIKGVRKIFKKSHTEHKMKKATREVLPWSFLPKLIVLILTIVKDFAANPKELSPELIGMVKSNWIFGIIFSIFLLSAWSRKQRAKF